MKERKMGCFFMKHRVDLWAPTASLLQGLIVMQQCVYQTTFRNVYEFKKWLARLGLVWSRALSHYCCHWMEKRLRACVHI